MTELIINTLKEAQQACFNGSVRGLRYQEWERCTSSPNGKGCAMNQGRPGVHCAIGWLVPWVKQSWAILGIKQSWTILGNYGTAIDCGLLHPALHAWYRQAMGEQLQFREFLKSLQLAHDGSRTPVGMEGSFKAIGIQFGLKWPEEESDE